MKRIARAIRDTGWPVAVSVEPHKSTRSTEQNAYMWALLNEISMQSEALLGRHYSAEVIHEYCKSRFLGIDVVRIRNDSRPISKSTTKLKVGEHADYCDQIAAWAIDELGLEFSIERKRA